MKHIIRSGALFIIIFSMSQVNVQAQFEQKLTLQFSAGSASLLNMEEYFSSGAMLNAGIQYNFSRRFGMTALVMYGMHFTNPDIIGDATFINMGLGLSAKYKFFHTRRVNPYLLFGFSACFLRLDIPEWDESIREPVAPGIITAMGLEFNLSENFALFLQLGYNESFPVNETGFGLGETYALLGINLNVFKSRTL